MTIPKLYTSGLPRSLKPGVALLPQDGRYDIRLYCPHAEEWKVACEKSLSAHCFNFFHGMFIIESSLNHPGIIIESSLSHPHCRHPRVVNPGRYSQVITIDDRIPYWQRPGAWLDSSHLIPIGLG